MKYHEIIAALTEEPMLITPAAHASLLKLFEQHAALTAAEFKAAREGTDMCGEEVELEQMEIDDGVACIPIGGPIGRRLGKFEKGAGAVDSGDILGDLRSAQKNPEVHAILLDIDSPGGMVAGTPELADQVAASKKPVYAFTSGLMASAAYWIGAGTERIFATRSATVGSIGVYAPFLDQSKAAEARGLKMEIISSGKYKGAGAPGTSLTEDHRAEMQRRVDELAGMFKSHVLEFRPGADLASMEGQVFSGATAYSAGLIDEIVGDREEVLNILRKRTR